MRPAYKQPRAAVAGGGGGPRLSAGGRAFLSIAAILFVVLALDIGCSSKA